MLYTRFPWAGAGSKLLVGLVILVTTACGGSPPVAPTAAAKQAPPSVAPASTPAAASPAAKAAAQSTTAAPEKVNMAISVQGTFEAVPAEVALDRGFWSKRGLAVEKLYMKGDAPAQQALAAGSADVGWVSGVGAVNAVSKGSPTKIVSGVGGSLGLFVVIVAPNSPIKSAADLKGKNIGITSAGSQTDWLVRKLAVSQGWDPETGINRIPLGGITEQMAALKQGSTDAFIWTAEQGYTLEENGDGRILLSFAQIVPEFQYTVLQATDDIIQKRPDTLRKFLAGWHEAVQYMKANKEYTVNLMAKAFNISPQAVAKTYDLDMKNISADGTFTEKAMEQVAQSLIDLKSIDSMPNLPALYTKQFVPVRVEQ